MALEKIEGKWYEDTEETLFDNPIFEDVEDRNARLVYDLQNKRIVLKYKYKIHEEPYN